MVNLVEDGTFADLADQLLGQTKSLQLMLPLIVEQNNVDPALQQFSLVLFGVGLCPCTGLLQIALNSAQREQSLFVPAQSVLAEPFEDQQIVDLQTTD